MSKVFISYSHEDREFAQWIRSALNRAGVSTALDDLDLAPGANFSSAIRNAIQAADALVVILSDRAVSSQNTGLEIGMATGLGKKVVAVLAPGTKLDSTILHSIADASITDTAQLGQDEAAEKILTALAGEGIRDEHTKV
ncbi:MAG: toll/interleukin-1 receptor domain-containing protein [Alphaproteobacteria bacterium]|nr:toll/interleukin-1 receptor domain-containing protein [Alphaproteobacteria bacterium]